MHLLFLHTKDLGPVPEDITVVQNYGYERVVAGPESATGDSILISAEPEAIRRWLGGKDVWTSSNPLLGSWTRHQVKMPESSL